MGNKTRISLLLTLFALLTGQVGWAGSAERAMAKRIHDRLTGIIATNSAIDDMETLLLGDPACNPDPTNIGCGKSAAEYAIDRLQNPSAYAFYNVTLKNFAAPWTNEEQTVFTPLNDYSATVIGLIRDGADFRRMLYDDVLYVGNASGLPAYDNSNNNHYEALETLDPATDGNFANTSILQSTTQSAETGLRSSATAGVITSRAAAMAFFSDGTNRAMFRFTLLNHLCIDMESIKDPSRNPDRVRRDTSRSPGGDSRVFMNTCLGCHAGMDGMTGAFASYDWSFTSDVSDGSLLYTQGSVTAKYNRNSNNFKYGYLTTDDSWVNYWRNGPNSKLGNRPGDNTPGWGYAGEVLDGNGNATGNGAKSLGMELANSKAFAQCQVDKAFKAICLRDANVFTADRNARDGFVSNFTGGGYNMRNVFTDVAAYCKGN